MKRSENTPTTSYRSLLLRLAVFLLAGAVLIGGITALFDPFYLYHAPFFGIPAVLDDRDNQMPGTVRNFTYDSVLVGSSVAENFNTDRLDAARGTRTLKVIRSTGSAADLLYYLEMAEEDHNLQQVIWCLDLFALLSAPEPTLPEAGVSYVQSASPLDDLPYLFNKEILFRTIPTMLGKALQGENTGGNAYNWAEGKDFSPAGAMRHYDRPVGIPFPTEQAPLSEERKSLADENLSAILTYVDAHPDTAFTFLYPPYSLLYWDSIYINGMSAEYLYAKEASMEGLLARPNVRVFDFQTEKYITDLNLYMDMMHYHPSINDHMLDCLETGACRVTADQIPERIDALKSLMEEISGEAIYRYYPE
ncbi:MAG: hypothetical protein K5891_09965 [Lachnospiraceae bacterium]|nr:hypothetical protein [Lachnospiraceae bacterium]